MRADRRAGFHAPRLRARQQTGEFSLQQLAGLWVAAVADDHPIGRAAVNALGDVFGEAAHGQALAEQAALHRQLALRGHLCDRGQAEEFG